MPTPSGDTMPTTFSDPSLDWSGGGATEATSPVAEPESTTTDSAQPPASATTSPENAPTDSAAPPESGPIPLERHKAILEDERKQRTDLEAKWQRVAWAETLADAGKSPEQIQQALQLFDGIDGDPAGFLERFYSALQEHPQYAPQIRSWAGRVLGGQRQTAAPQPNGGAQPHGDDPEPQPDYQDQSGTPFYGAARLAEWGKWRDRQLEARINERINPLLEDRQQAQQRQQLEQQRASVEAGLRTELETLRKQPHFKEHESKVKAYLASKQWKASLAEAWNHVLVTDVLPSLNSTVKAQTLAELQTQAAASSLKPNSSAPVTQGSPKGFMDPNLKW
jgi:hypothetical protein